MGRSTRQAELAAMERDLVWALLWGKRGNWVRSGALWHAWLDGRPISGCAFEPDYISRQRVTPHLRRLVQDGRAEERRRPGHHPEWRAVEPAL